MTLSGAFERYRQDKIVFGNQSHKTEESSIYTLRSLTSFIGGDIELSDLTFEIIRKWKLSLEKRGLVSRTIRGYIINLRVVLKYMKQLGVDCIDHELISIPKRVDRPPSVLSSEDVSNLLKLVDETSNCSLLNKVRNKAIISLLYSSGIRISELCSLNREDVKESSFTVFGKGQKSRPCFIDERTRALLDEYLALRTDAEPALFVDGFVCSRVKSGSLQALFRRLTKRGGFKKPIHPHLLRHSYATNLLKNGCHIYTLSRLMGHSNIATTQIYLHLYDAELAEAHQKYHSI